MNPTASTKPPTSTVDTRPQTRTERVALTYCGRTVAGRKLTVQSQIPMPIARAWANVRTPALLRFIAAGMISFHFLDGEWPAVWAVGPTYRLKMRIFGFLPFGGIHHLYVDRMEESTYEIATREWDRAAKVWNHTIKLQALSPTRIHYTDEIIIYGGILTGLVTAFAKYFYQHRQRRWQLVAKQGLDFTIPQGEATQAAHSNSPDRKSADH